MKEKETYQNNKKTQVSGSEFADKETQAKYSVVVDDSCLLVGE